MYTIADKSNSSILKYITRGLTYTPFLFFTWSILSIQNVENLCSKKESFSQKEEENIEKIRGVEIIMNDTKNDKS